MRPNANSMPFTPPRRPPDTTPRPGAWPPPPPHRPGWRQPAPPQLTRRDLLQGKLLPSNLGWRQGYEFQPRAQAIADHPLPPRPATAPDLPPLAAIAFNRMAFGPRPGDWDDWQGLGANDEQRLQAYVAQQLAPNSIQDSDCDARIAGGGFLTLHKSLRQLWQDHVIDNNDYSWYVRPAEETYHVTWLRAIYSKRQLLEVLVDFWHNHFNVYAMDQAAPVFVHYDRDVIRANALGNFRTFIEAVGSSTAMLFYLDNAYSNAGGPNENYARELLELHTLGADAYFGHMEQGDVPLDAEGRPIAFVDEDVYEAARALTGWTVNGSYWDLPPYDPGPPERFIPGTFLAWSDWHDRFQKHVLGVRLPSNQGPLTDGRQVFDLAAAHPATARHVCRKLCQRLIADNPPQSVVDAAVAVWQANLDAPDQIKKVVRTILLSNEFKTTWGEKIKRPLELIASVLRGANAEWTPDWDWIFYWWYSGLGQRLFEWPAPNGHPDHYTAWTSTSVMLHRWNVPSAILQNWMEPDVQVNLVGEMPAQLTTTNQIVDWWVARLLGRSLNAEDHAEVIAFMAQGFHPDNPLPADQIADRLPSLVHLICMTPDFQYR